GRGQPVLARAAARKRYVELTPTARRPASQMVAPPGLLPQRVRQTRAHNKTNRPNVLTMLLTQCNAPQRFKSASASASLSSGPPRSERFVGIMTVSVYGITAPTAIPPNAHSQSRVENASASPARRLTVASDACHGAARLYMCRNPSVAVGTPVLSLAGCSTIEI